MRKQITRITPIDRTPIIDLFEIWKYRDLLYFLVYKDIKSKYAQTILGLGWAILVPLSQVFIFSIVFGRLAGLDSEGVPYFLFCLVGMIPWIYFSNVLMDSSNILIQNRAVLTKVYFPKILLPLSTAISKILDLFVGFGVLVVFLVFQYQYFSLEILILPILMIIMMTSALGLGMIFGSLSIQYRDVKYGVPLFIRILMFSLPIVYSMKIIPESFHLFYAINPMVGVIEGMRAIFLGVNSVPWKLLLIGGGGQLS